LIRQSYASFFICQVFPAPSGQENFPHGKST
jgi:hypothetical protein